MTAFGIWWCEAYGPPQGDADPAKWPRCFIHGDDGLRCGSADICAHTMAAERRRVFGRISELAAEGDGIGAMLAEEFGSPDQLLGGAPPD